jgi:C-terminal processing protease CtpA/Prc
VSYADPAGYPTPVDYFDQLKTKAITPSQKPKDPYHFLSSTEAWQQLSQSGVSSGYGVQWAVLAPSPPRRVVAAYNEPNSPAFEQSVGRGAELIEVDGVKVLDGDFRALNAGLFPSTAGESHTFKIAGPPERTATMVSRNVESAPVRLVQTVNTPTGPVGYLLFNSHIATAEFALISAIQQLQTAGVTDLVLDIRYNGGGYLDVANELAFMVAGPTATRNKTFEKTQFNDKYPNSDPVTGRPLASSFRDTALGFSAPANQALPHLDLPRVFVLTSGSTCSASESIINGLRGIDVQVIQIGRTTCGKPYGFYPWDNCGTTYFSIQFQGVNAKGFGDYADGFVPGGADASGLPGCGVADDFTHQLGDPAEARFAAALFYRANQRCPAAAQALHSGSSLEGFDPVLVRSPWHENRIYRR